MRFSLRFVRERLSRHRDLVVCRIPTGRFLKPRLPALGDPTEFMLISAARPLLGSELNPRIAEAHRPARTTLADKTKVKIKLKDFVTDIRAGLDDESLIERHGLTETMLPKVIEQLLAAGHISDEDLLNRTMLDSTQKVANLFSFPFDSDGKD